MLTPFLLQQERALNGLPYPICCCGKRVTHWDGWLCKCCEKAYAEKDAGAFAPFKGQTYLIWCIEHNLSGWL